MELSSPKPVKKGPVHLNSTVPICASKAANKRQLSFETRLWPQALPRRGDRQESCKQPSPLTLRSQNNLSAPTLPSWQSCRLSKLPFKDNLALSTHPTAWASS